MERSFIALLGRREKPTDGIEDYCHFLGGALSQQRVTMETVRVDWDEVGWIAALRKLRAQMGDWRGAWIVVHYTALSWSRRGFPLGVLFVIASLRRRGLRCAVLFHEHGRQLSRARLRDKIRGSFQDWVIRRCFHASEKAIFTVPFETIPWLRGSLSKACYIPIGANIPQRTVPNNSSELNVGGSKTVAVFCLSAGKTRSVEIADMAVAAQHVRASVGKVRFVILGKGSNEARGEIQAALCREGVEVRVLGRLSADEVANTLAAADVLLFLGAWVTQTRGSALAAVACGLPIVGYSAPIREPIHDAGVLLAHPGDPEALAAALVRVLNDDSLRRELRKKNLAAQESEFSWNRIAAAFVRSLSPERSSATTILLFSRDFLPKLGGTQTVVADLARGLTNWKKSTPDQAIAVTVLTDTGASGANDDRFPFLVIRRPRLLTTARLIRESDIVHLAGPAMTPLALSLILRKPVVVEHHGFQTICPNGQLFYEPTGCACPGHFMARHYSECMRCTRRNMGAVRSAGLLASTPIRRWLCNRVQVNVTPTHWLASQLKLNRQKCVHHGISMNVDGGRPFVAEGCSSTFAFIGRLVSTKGIRVLLRAFEQLCSEGRSPSLVIIGAGPEEESLRHECVKFGSSLRFLHDLSDSQVDQALASVANVVMPSLAGEVFGLVALENMIRGKLLIVSDLGSLKEVIGDTGLVFPAGDATALAACMRVAMDDPSRARTLACAARERAERLFSDAQMIEGHVSLYQHAMASKEPNSSTDMAERANGN